MESAQGPDSLCRLSAHESLTRRPGSRIQVLESVSQTLPGSPLHSLHHFSSTICLPGSGLAGAGTSSCKHAPPLVPQRRKARCACLRREGSASCGSWPSRSSGS